MISRKVKNKSKDKETTRTPLPKTIKLIRIHFNLLKREKAAAIVFKERRKPPRKGLND